MQALPCYSGRRDAIRNLISLPDEHFDALVEPILYRFAEWVQSNPASEYDHHAGEWGMLEHTLDTVINALKLRRGYLLPQGVGSEEINKRADIWTYAMLLGGIFHDIMKVSVDQSVVLYDKRKRKLGHGMYGKDQ